MDFIVYVQLLNEGTVCYRPVPADKIRDFVYRIGVVPDYFSSFEEWEFPPGSIVEVKYHRFHQENSDDLVAYRLFPGSDS